MTLETIWMDVQLCLKTHLSGPGFQTFLSSATPVSFEDNVLTLDVSNDFSKEWIVDKCEPILKRERPDLFESCRFIYRVNAAVDPDPDEQLDFLSGELEDAPISQPQRKIESVTLNPKYNFDSFIVGHNNRFAYAAAIAVAKSPAKAYNPLFIYGSVGLGKTHLLHAMGLQIQERFSGKIVKLVSCEKFTNDLINSIRDRKVESFREKYRKVDVLIVDDIQFLAKKEQTQEEFFHTFNDLYNEDKQIILTSDRPPKEIPTLEDRLRTRFEWGLIVDIQAPELETRIAILRKKVETNHYVIPEDILNFIATQIPTNVREMEGALTRIMAYSALMDSPVTLSMASSIIRDMIGTKQEKPLTIQAILKVTSDHFQITISDLCSKNRTKEIAYARQIAMYLCRELTPLSLPKIGQSFGKRDHSTVMHACDKIKTMIASDKETESIVHILTEDIKQISASS